MSGYLSYLNHILSEPAYFFRRFDLDLNSCEIEPVKRVALIALPFLSLYRPFGQTISITMGTTRAFTHLKSGSISLYRGQFLQGNRELTEAALATIAVAACYFNFKAGLFVTTSVDLAISLRNACFHLRNRQFKEVATELLQAASLMLYLGIIWTGSLEITLVSMLLQAIIELSNSYREFEKGHLPETVAKLTFAMIRFYQGHEQYKLIERKNTLLSLEKFASLLEQIQKGKEVYHLIDSPLNEPYEEVQLFDAEGKPYPFGAHFHGLGKGIVKGMNIEASGKTELKFKVNHVFRNHLESIVQKFKEYSPSELKEFLALCGSHANGIRIEEQLSPLADPENDFDPKEYKISFDGLGSLTIGSSPEYGNLYNNIKVEAKNLYRSHEILSFFNLNPALQFSSQDDIERLKIGHLFRIFSPKNATHFERTEEFFTLPIQELKAKIIERSPEMEKLFENHLHTMERAEILPGRIRYTIPALSKIAYEMGARGLITAITGPTEEALARTASILRMGIIANEMRENHGMKIPGLSNHGDYFGGSADSVFTQLVTDSAIESKLGFNRFYLGKIRLIFSLDAFATGTYQFNCDNYGDRIYIDPNSPFWERWGRYFDDNATSYVNRPNLSDFIKNEQREATNDHEVMIKERIPPSMIKGIIVDDAQTKHDLVSYLDRCNIPLDNGFIHVGTKLTGSMFA